MHPAFSRTDHRPWPVPSRPWTWRQTWRDLLFAHWPVPAEILRPLVPSRLTIQEHEGTSWIGVVPFRMTGVSPRWIPDLPWLSAFPELNLRLYVELDGKPGVWFLSLDAANPVAVWAARRFFHLPYFYADMSIGAEGDTFQYRSERRGATVRFAGSYRPTSPPYEATPGSLEHFLTERYCLYAQAPDGTLYRAEVHHRPWPLQKAEADIVVNDMASPHGLKLDGPPALLHFARKIDVVVWPLVRVASSSRGH
jgi:uncharacterized protein